MSTDSGNAPKAKPFLQLASHAGYISGQFCSHTKSRKSELNYCWSFSGNSHRLLHGTLVDSTDAIHERLDAEYNCKARTALVVAAADLKLAADLLETKADGRVKLYLTSRALACRAAYPDLFARGAYVPLAAEGAAADHVVAFARRDAENEFITVVPRLVVGLTGKELVDPIGPNVWSDTRLLLPDAEPGTRYRDVFSGETNKASAGDDGAVLPLAEVFAAFPFALLQRTSSS